MASFGDEDVRRISATVQWAEGQMRNPRQERTRGAPSSPDVQLVKVTSTTLDDDRYPGMVQDYDSVADTFSDREGGDCWVVATNAGTLGADIYPARRVGAAGDPERPVFVADDHGAAAGAPLNLKKYTVEYTEFSGPTGVTTITLDPLPANAFVMSGIMKTKVGFALVDGFGHQMVLSLEGVGVLNHNASFSSNSNINIFVPNNFYDYGGTVTVQLRLTINGGQPLSNLTAGELDLWILYLLVS